MAGNHFFDDKHSFVTGFSRGPNFELKMAPSIFSGFPWNEPPGHVDLTNDSTAMNTQCTADLASDGGFLSRATSMLFTPTSSGQTSSNSMGELEVDFNILTPLAQHYLRLLGKEKFAKCKQSLTNFASNMPERSNRDKSLTAIPAFQHLMSALRNNIACKTCGLKSSLTYNGLGGSKGKTVPRVKCVKCGTTCNISVYFIECGCLPINFDIIPETIPTAPPLPFVSPIQPFTFRQTTPTIDYDDSTASGGKRRRIEPMDFVYDTASETEDNVAEEIMTEEVVVEEYGQVMPTSTTDMLVDIAVVQVGPRPSQAGRVVGVPAPPVNQIEKSVNERSGVSFALVAARLNGAKEFGKEHRKTLTAISSILHNDMPPLQSSTTKIIENKCGVRRIYLTNIKYQPIRLVKGAFEMMGLSRLALLDMHFVGKAMLEVVLEASALYFFVNKVAPQMKNVKVISIAIEDAPAFFSVEEKAIQQDKFRNKLTDRLERRFNDEKAPRQLRRYCGEWLLKLNGGEMVAEKLVHIAPVPQEDRPYYRIKTARVTQETLNASTPAVARFVPVSEVTNKLGVKQLVLPAILQGTSVSNSQHRHPAASVSHRACVSAPFMANSSTAEIESNMGVRRFYLHGIPRRRISTIKTLFTDRSFPPSAIVNIEFLSSKVIECIVRDVHTAVFVEKCHLLNDVGIVFVQDDPTLNLSQESITTLAQRLQKVPLRPSAPSRVRDFYTAWVSSLGDLSVAPTPVPSHL